jgi:hypothetical protein
VNLDRQNDSAKLRDSQLGIQPDPQADSKIDGALKLLNSVQPAARFEQRVHARLAQAQEARAAGPANSAEKLVGLMTGYFSWPRAAFALATFTAGVLAATLGLPLLHHPAPATTPTGSGTPTVTPAATGTGAPGTVASDPSAIHPGFTVRTPDGRAAALNTMGTVATVRSRNAHSDTQLASRHQDHVQAKLAKPARPKAGQPAIASEDSQPAPANAQRLAPAAKTPAQSNGTAAAPPNN